MDLTKPIDITAINNTGKQYQKELRTLARYDALSILSKFKMISGVKDSTQVSEVQHTDEGSGKYNGIFNAARKSGTIVPRTLTVYACVHEVADEPERYRRTFLNETLSEKTKHPFERWLIEYELGNASENLYNVLATAVRSEVAGNVALSNAFNGFLTILRAEVTAGNISVALKNQFQFTAVLSKTNIGDQLKAMYRSLPAILKEKGVTMFMSIEHGEMYDDWYKANHDAPPAVDVAGQTTLEGSNGKCKMERLGCMPYADDEIFITIADNIVWGTDDMNDMKTLRAFESGNPYLFTAVMKYQFGMQFESIHPRKLCFSKKFAG